MQKIEITKRIADVGAMAIVRVTSDERACEIANGCLDGGINCMEISYTSPHASDILVTLKNRFADRLILGAGTVLDPQTAVHAILSGAQFIIAPNFNREVAKTCNRYQIPYAPGCTSLSEAILALEYGAAFIKAFPISDFYGPKLVSVFKTPIPTMPILVSGGISMELLCDYIRKGADCCGFGGLLTKGSRDDIAIHAKQIKAIIDETRTSMRDPLT